MIMTDQIILLIHFASTWFMTGVIWLVQLAQYPLFAYVDSKSFPSYYSRYVTAIGKVVILPMVAELFTGAWLLKIFSGSDQSMLSIIGFTLIVLIWCSTVLLQVPRHKKLKKGFDRNVGDALVFTNWLRTGLWTLRAILVTVLMWKSFSF